MKQQPPRPEMVDLLSEEELLNAGVKCKNGKTSGESGILPGMVNATCSDDEFVSRLLKLMQLVWKKCQVPSAWCDLFLSLSPRRATSADVTTEGGSSAQYCWEVGGYDSPEEVAKVGCRIAPRVTVRV